ncbi:MAG TPA: G1 family glutamic endopeptidase [Stellaceae bacterium]|nr:G1 family glutamic endopeptidase [Stellaceae bacterium]
MPKHFLLPARVAGLVLVGVAGLALFAFPQSPSTPVPRHGPIHVRRHHDGSLKRGLRNEWISNNWSGYELANFQTAQKYTEAQMSWVVPTVRYGPSTDTTSSPQYSANWVGIGGFCENSACFEADNTLIQLGTEQDVAADGTTQYYAWYEVLPQPEVPLPARYGVKPGDRISASLKCVGLCSSGWVQIWQLTMTDRTQAWTWSRELIYGSSMLSAEWIEEAPYDGGILPLADFGTAGFSATRGANGQPPSLSVTANAIQIEDPWGQTANPSAADPAEDFNVCWGYQTDTLCTMP